jgi:hypothetical protein
MKFTDIITFYMQALYTGAQCRHVRIQHTHLPVYSLSWRAAWRHAGTP